jgi:predicted amidohydrolase
MSVQFLKVANVHMDVEYGNPKKNLDLLVWLCRSAAALGAKIICAPEMCLSGYVYKSPSEIMPMAESLQGQALEVLTQVANECQAFLVVGMAEKDDSTGMLYNSAFAISPNGQLVCHYRKINAESRWASPGQSAQDNVFMTPWGGVGLLICSDSYHALLMRVTAMKGASLVLLPTSWPLDESDFPVSLFKARAIENGLWILAANRGGQEAEIDFSSAKSFMVAPDGQLVRGSYSGVDHRVKAYDLPLNDKEQIDDRRALVFSSRQPDQYHRIYSDISRIKNLTGYCELPKQGYLDVHALAPGSDNPVVFLERVIDSFKPDSLVLMPQADYNDEHLRQVNKLAKKYQIGIFGARVGNGTKFFVSRQTGNLINSNFTSWPVYDFGPARLLLVDLESVRHPEVTVAAAKDGVDLILCPAQELSSEDILLLTLRPIEQAAVVASSVNSALVSLIPDGHGAGRGLTVKSGQVATYTVDTHLTRHKQFQDRVDYGTIFREPILTKTWLQVHP